MPTKLGAHVLRAAPDLSEFIQARPAVVSSSVTGGWSETSPAASWSSGPRRGVTMHNFNTGKTPFQAARQYVQDLATYRSNPLIKYWEGTTSRYGTILKTWAGTPSSRSSV